LQKLENNCVVIAGNIKNAVLISYFTIAFSIVSGILYTPWMVSELGMSDYGLYTLAMSVIAFFAIDFGLGLAVSKFLSEYLASGDLDSARKFLSIAHRLFTVISFLFFLALIVFYTFIDVIFVELTELEFKKFKDIFLIAGFFSIISLTFKPYEGVLIAHERFVFIKLLNLAHTILVLILMIMALLLDYGLYALVSINAIVGLVKIVMQYVYIKKYTEMAIDLFISGEKELYVKLFNFSTWTTVATVSQRFIIMIVPVALAALSGTTQISIFAIAVVIEGYIWMLSNSIGGLFLPRIERIITNSNNNKEIEGLMIKVGRLQLLVISLLIIGFTVIGSDFLFLWVGSEFADSYYVLIFLVAHSIITLPQEIAQTVIIARSKIKYRAFASLITAFISLSLSLFLIEEYGAIGAAFSIFIGNIFGSLIFMNVVYLKILRLDMWRFFKRCHLDMAAPLLLTAIFALAIQNIFNINTLIFFTLKVLLIILVYSILMWLMGLNNYEKSLFRNLFIKRQKRDGRGGRNLI
jgi:O-antigen/teichoic acid export membrane protein